MSRDRLRWLPVLLFAALMLLPYRGGGSLFAIREYDDGVHYAAAVDLLGGRLPYRAFAFLQPPGSTLLLTPFALLGRLTDQPVGLLAARIAIMLVGLVTVSLLWRLCRGGPASRLLVTGLYVCSPDVLIAHRTVLLEPVLDLAAVGGLVLLAHPPWTPRRVVASGVVFGLATEVKLFAAVLPIAVALVLLQRRAPRLAALHLAAALASSLLVIAPFWLAAPAATRDVVSTQLWRPADGIPVGTGRLLSVTGMHGWRLHLPQVLLLALLVVAAVVAGWLARRDPLGRVAAAGSLLAAAALGTSASFFDHYGAFPLTLLATLVARAGPPDRGGRPAAVSVTLGLVVALAVEAAGSVHLEAAPADSTSIAHAAAAVDPHRACAFTDSVSLLIAADRYRISTWLPELGRRTGHRADAAPDDPARLLPRRVPAPAGLAGAGPA